MKDRSVLFSYPAAITHSGQTTATELCMDALEKRGWNCASVEFPPFNRSNLLVLEAISFLIRALRSWFLVFHSAVFEERLLVFNHGQSLVSFFRMGVPHLLLRVVLPNRIIITSLHGSSFMEWGRWRPVRMAFLCLLKASNYITVLGENQRDWLISVGIDAEKLVFVPNTASVPVISREAVEEKHSMVSENSREPIVLLHLSLLIESKGFPVFLKACHSLVKSGICNTRPIEVLLVGPIASTSYCSEFADSVSKRQFITDQLDKLNAVESVTARWIEGVSGEEKVRVLQSAHIFVFPSEFPVEAQPLVVLEAMSSGCAVVASTKGEISQMTYDGAGYSLDEITESTVRIALEYLINDQDMRKRLAVKGLERVVSTFSEEIYCDNWENLLMNGISGLKD